MYNVDKLNEAITGFSNNYLLNLNEFAFEKLVGLWDKWKKKAINTELLDNLIGMKYQDFLDFANKDAVVKEIKELIFKIVAYCDLKANNKAVLNEYDDKRTIAECGIRQNAWVAQLLKYKKDISLVKDSIINVIQFIENPVNHYPIVSEDHKIIIYNYFIGDGNYSKESFGNSMNKFFDKNTHFDFTNPLNKTNLYSDIIYAMKDEWMEKPQIEGVFACDTKEWKDEFIEGVAKCKYGCMNWDKNFVNYKEVYPKLQQTIDGKKYFEFYIVENYKAVYKARVIDFAISKESYDEKVPEWSEKTPFWFYQNYKDYDGNIIMLIDSFTKLDNPIDIKYFVTYKNASYPVRNNVVAFTKIMNQSAIDMNNFISKTTQILKTKKNIILQGAPGTGKTYNTAALALSILGIDTAGMSHGDIMKEYDKYLKKQIFFTTFHQSMDYEGFIEGIKPEVLENGNGVKYNVEDGILKKSITEAKGKPVVIIIDEINRGNVSKIFGELITLVEADKRIDSSDENNHHLSVILPYSKQSFGIPENVYFIGTMNTTDRSTGTIDYALRRRFAFVTLTSDRDTLNGIKNDSARELALLKFDSVKDFIINNKTSDFEVDDLMIGHSYFLSESVDELKLKLEYEVVPLLKEYLKDGIIRNNEETKNFVKSLLD